MFYCGDHDEGKKTVHKLAADLGAVLETVHRAEHADRCGLVRSARQPGEHEGHARIDAGFVVHERLHLLRRTLDDLPNPDAPTADLRRSRAAERAAVLAVDASAFPPFWRLDDAGLQDAMAATPSSRLRVATARTEGAPIVVKADGLAAGKGVVVAMTAAAAHAAIDACFSGAFGAAGAEVVVEEFLVGEEASFFALVDGATALPLAAAQDHKRVFDGDEGPNTGGMGAYSPAPVMTPAMTKRTMAEIIRPTVAALARRGTPFRGVLFAGLMITATGPKLIEYNVRFGDPECQALLLRLRSDFLSALVATCDGMLDHFDLRWRDEAAIAVVMAARGYPGDYAKGSAIAGLDAARTVPGVEIFHAGTARRDGTLIATGGRVLNVCAHGRDITEARTRAYAAIDRIDWPGGFCRRDIGWRAVDRQT